MKSEYLSTLSLTQLDAYASVIGIDTTKKKTKEEKIQKIQDARGRVATIECFGLDLHVPIKKLHDKRIADKLMAKEQTDENFEDAIKMLLGEEQYQKLVERATDDDGTVDTDAIGYAIAYILNSDALKNF